MRRARDPLKQGRCWRLLHGPSPGWVTWAKRPWLLAPHEQSAAPDRQSCDGARIRSFPGCTTLEASSWSMAPAHTAPRSACDESFKCRLRGPVCSAPDPSPTPTPNLTLPSRHTHIRSSLVFWTPSPPLPIPHGYIHGSSKTVRSLLPPAIPRPQDTAQHTAGAPVLH